LELELVEVFSGSTNVVMVTTPPSERVETIREMLQVEVLLVVGVVKSEESEVVEMVVEVVWEVVDCVEELDEGRG